jgi:hypothetical protein
MIQVERLQDYTVTDTGCWNWDRCLSKDGYGRYDSQITSHRASFLYFKGEIPKHMEIDHICKNRRCMKPKHLRLVTHQTNMDRAVFFNSEKTHCKRGHEFNKKNTRVDYGKRACKTCAKELRVK